VGGEGTSNNRRLRSNPRSPQKKKKKRGVQPYQPEKKKWWGVFKDYKEGDELKRILLLNAVGP